VDSGMLSGQVAEHLKILFGESEFPLPY